VANAPEPHDSALLSASPSGDVSSRIGAHRHRGRRRNPWNRIDLVSRVDADGRVQETEHISDGTGLLMLVEGFFTRIKSALSQLNANN